ncbi:MAG TPA: hypothetical protein VFW80_09085 [Gaiellaceae bacterium]|nr:hypothetical protein [Gaiellaceae bacterium]
MAETPDQIVLGRHRDLKGRRHQVWVRRGILAVLAVVPILGLANVFGQHSSAVTASGPSASLTLDAPTRLRSGLLYEAHFTVQAREGIEHAALVLHPDWLKGMTLNTLEPAPTDETSENGRIRLDYGAVPAGQRLEVFLQYQVNPTSTGKRRQWVDLVDGDTVLASIQRTLVIFP